MMIAESAPSYQGQELATKLAREGIETTLITDSAVFAIMSRVNKVHVQSIVCTYTHCTCMFVCTCASMLHCISTFTYMYMYKCACVCDYIV